MENNKQECARESRYEEADQLKAKIEELRKSLLLKRKKDLELQHYSEMENLEQAYTREVEEFNTDWETKFQELEERSKAYDEALRQKHTKEMDELYVYLEQKLPKNVKYSKQYLDLKNQEENLVKLQR